ncbi:MAG: Wzz/FepE/Etk N-terminal domain-containing protein [Candidatus Magasanikiibacteriota bacterium]
MFIEKRIFDILKNSWKLIIFVGIIFAVLTLFASLLFPLEYRADAQVMIISKSRYGVDPYTVAKSGERIASNLSEVIGTQDFFDKVMSQSGYGLDNSKFQNVSEKTKRKRWEKTAKTSVVYGTSMLNISAFHEDPEQAKQYAGAVAGALVSQSSDYVGGDVYFKVVNYPIVTSLPVRPNIAVNMLVSLVFGWILSALALIKRHI